ncbi:MAG: hypothetical protein JSV89_22520 [Spirochaetaceae bacterium]|nr:MAG: hypothetical protein JSV89_22520 [Spirochaetaceae bacterium]
MQVKSNALQLFLLGPPRLERCTAAVHLPRKKELALLAYMAFGKQAYNRDTLATLLWPNEGDSHARGSLRRMLYELRKILGEELLPVEGERVGPLEMGPLEDPRLWVDIEEFQGLLAQARKAECDRGAEAASQEQLLGQAVELYRGDFLAGFTLGKCGEFSDWQFFQGEYLRRELCGALECLVEICEREGKIDEGIACGRRLVDVDPLNEEAHCALMRLYSQSGQREAALRQYRFCVKLLNEELGVEPEEETVEQYERIRDSRPAKRRLQEPGHRKCPRLAVLPCKSLAMEREQDWFSDGMTDALITELSQQAGLEVISYTSSVRYKNTTKSLRQIAAELNVDYLLEGAVLKAGDEVRISAQLVEAAADRHMWAESHRGHFADILQLQEKLAGSIAFRVAGTLASRLSKPAAQEISSEAREACMLGDYFLRRSQSDEEIEKAREFYRKALAGDPHCADAYAGLAFSFFTLGGYGRDVEPSPEGRRMVGQLIESALQIDPSNARARMVLGGMLLEWDWNWAAAEREFQTVLRIKPNHIETLNWYSELKMDFGQFAEALTLVQRAYRVNPLDPVTLIHLYRYHRAVFQWRRSLDILDRIDELAQGRSGGSFHRSWVYLMMGNYESAVPRLKKLITIPIHYDYVHGFLAYAFGKLGQKADALEIITEMIDWRQRGRKVAAYYIGLAFHGAGMNDEALHWLEVSLADHELDLCGLPIRILWDDLHWDHRFQDIVLRLGLPLQLEYIREALDRRARTASRSRG